MGGVAGVEERSKSRRTWSTTFGDGAFSSGVHCFGKEAKEMKTTVRATVASVVLATFNLAAQTPAGLGIQTYAGLSITGAVRTVYSIEYLTDLGQTNNPSAWRCLEYLQLPASPYLWADKSAAATGTRYYRAVPMNAPTNMVFIPPGTFRMGCSPNEFDSWWFEGPQTDVIISRGFWMGKYEVTQGEYLAVMGSNPSYFNGDRSGPNYYDRDFGTNLSRPVETVCWFEATNYCAGLTERERAAGRIAANCAYRLPTAAEWEYACRGRTSTRFSYGDDPDYTDLTNYAWDWDNSGLQTHPVGQKLPNPWGLYDMPGNVWEWCQDRWAEYLPGGIVLDPRGPETGSYRIRRGGSCAHNAAHCRSAYRISFIPGIRDYYTGFRPVLAPDEP